MTSPDRPHLLVVDDDRLSRELLLLLAADAGFGVETFDSGLALLEHLSSLSNPRVNVLADMQMPGICGDSLAILVRAACDPQSILLAMSGSPVRPELRRNYDAFLLKPFSMDELAQAIAAVQRALPQPEDKPAETEVLDRRIFLNLAEMMPLAQLEQLYRLCADDTGRRADLLLEAASAGDAKAWRAAAHSIKGGSAMVGATELAALAASMEHDPQMLFAHEAVPQLLRALERFKHILVQHLELPTLHSPTQHPGDA